MGAALGFGDGEETSASFFNREFGGFKFRFGLHIVEFDLWHLLSFWLLAKPYICFPEKPVRNYLECIEKICLCQIKKAKRTTLRSKGRLTSFPARPLTGPQSQGWHVPF